MATQQPQLTDRQIALGEIYRFIIERGELLRRRKAQQEAKNDQPNQH
jgi:hypothetical protein